MGSHANHRFASGPRPGIRGSVVPLCLRVYLSAIAAISWYAGALPAEPDRLGSLAANGEVLTWTPAEGAAVSGTHKNGRLESSLRKELAGVFTPDGLKVGDESTPVSQLLVQVGTVTRDSVDVAFARNDPSQPPAELLWAPQQAVRIAAGDVWFGDVVILDAGSAIEGEVIGNLIAIGSDVTIGNGATIRGDVVVIGGVLRQRGDAKIYGRVFAPGGHRRPRLIVPRAGELEEEGYEWGPTFSYDRADGFRLGVGGVVQNANAATRVGLWTAYAFASETWQFRFDIQHKFLASGVLEARGALFRMTETGDGQTVDQSENTAFALLAGSDYRDYFGADGGELSLALRYHELGLLTVTYRNADYRWLSANRNLWHLFRPDHDFRENFSTLGGAIDAEELLEGNSSSALTEIRIAPVESGRHPIGFNGSLVLTYEAAGGMLGGDYDYDRLTLSGQGGWYSGHQHRVMLRALYGTGRRGLPPDKLYYSGGIGTLRGYPQKVFFGDQTFIGNFEYHFVYWENPLGDAALILFWDLGRTTFDENFWDPDEFFSGVGFGLDFGGTFRIDAAKGLDNTDRDIRVSVRVAKPW